MRLEEIEKIEELYLLKNSHRYEIQLIEGLKKDLYWVPDSADFQSVPTKIGRFVFFENIKKHINLCNFSFNDLFCVLLLRTRIENPPIGVVGNLLEELVV